jgi:hypothetical protein
MSYIFIDVDASRQCVALINDKTTELRAVLSESANPKLSDFCARLAALSGDLSAVTEAYASEDERLKAVHLRNNEGGRIQNG